MALPLPADIGEYVPQDMLDFYRTLPERVKDDYRSQVLGVYNSVRAQEKRDSATEIDQQQEQMRGLLMELLDADPPDFSEQRRAFETRLGERRDEAEENISERLAQQGFSSTQGINFLTDLAQGEQRAVADFDANIATAQDQWKQNMTQLAVSNLMGVNAQDLQQYGIDQQALLDRMRLNEQSRQFNELNQPSDLGDFLTGLFGSGVSTLTGYVTGGFGNYLNNIISPSQTNNFDYGINKQTLSNSGSQGTFGFNF
jgi:hypothetical protein